MSLKWCKMSAEQNKRAQTFKAFTLFDFLNTLGLQCNAKFSSEAVAEPERKPGLILGFSSRDCVCTASTAALVLGTSNRTVSGYATSPSTAAFSPNCTGFQMKTVQSKSDNSLYGHRLRKQSSRMPRRTNPSVNGGSRNLINWGCKMHDWC